MVMACDNACMCAQRAQGKPLCPLVGETSERKRLARHIDTLDYYPDENAVRADGLNICPPHTHTHTHTNTHTHTHIISITFGFPAVGDFALEEVLN